MRRNKALQYVERALGRDVISIDRYLSESQIEALQKAHVLDWIAQQDESIPAATTLATAVEAWERIQGGWRA